MSVTNEDIERFGDFLEGAQSGAEVEPKSEEVDDATAEQDGGDADNAPEDGSEDSGGGEGAGEVDGEAEEAPADDTPAEPSEPTGDADDTDDTGAEVDWEKRYKDLQSHTDRQLAEMQGTVEQQVQEQLQQFQQQQAEAQQQAQMQQPVDMEVLSEQVKQNPTMAFQAAVQARPDLIDPVIGFIAEHHGAVEAEQARGALRQMEQAMYQQQMAEFQQQQQQERMAAEAPKMLEEGINSIVDSVKESDDFKDVFDDLQEPAAQILEQEWAAYTEMQGHPPSPDMWQGLVEKSFLRAWQQTHTANAATEDTPPPPAPHVETGGERVRQPNKQDDVVGSMIEMHQQDKAF